MNKSSDLKPFCDTFLQIIQDKYVAGFHFYFLTTKEIDFFSSWAPLETPNDNCKRYEIYSI